MQFKWNRHSLVVTRESSDKKFYNESALLYHIKNELNKKYPKLDFIKKLVWKDGHMMGDDNMHYIRQRNTKGDCIALYSPVYDIRSLHEDWNGNGQISLCMSLIGETGSYDKLIQVDLINPESVIVLVRRLTELEYCLDNSEDHDCDTCEYCERTWNANNLAECILNCIGVETEGMDIFY